MQQPTQRSTTPSRLSRVVRVPPTAPLARVVLGAARIVAAIPLVGALAWASGAWAQETTAARVADDVAAPLHLTADAPAPQPLDAAAAAPSVATGADAAQPANAMAATTAPVQTTDAPPVPRRLPDGTWEIELLSPVYTVDREYRSMTGPWSTQKVSLGDSSELVWVLGYKATMAGPDGVTDASQEYMCHSNLDFDPGRHQQAFGGSKSITSRLFTLSQGQLEVAFPEGFGMPLLGDEPLSLTTQVLNLNPTGQTLGVRHRVTIHYAKGSELGRPLIPLFTKGVYGLELLEGPNAYFGVDAAQPEVHGPGCLQGQNATSHVFEDPQGKKFTGHWVVKPGREENRTLVTKILDLPYDTSIHYIAVHLHPFAESLELRDLTTGTTVFKSSTRPFPDRIGLAHVDSFSSVEGLPLYKDHEYELVSVYLNTTDRDQDSMAVMNLYLLDREFRPPAQPAPAGDGGSRAGEAGAAPAVAPVTASQGSR